MVVAEEFRGGVFADSQRASIQDADFAAGDFVEIGSGGEEFVASAADVGGDAFGHSEFDGLRDLGESVVGRHDDAAEAVAFLEARAIFAWRGVGEHSCLFCIKCGEKKNRPQGH